MAKSTFGFKAAALIAAGGLFIAGCGGGSSSTNTTGMTDGDTTPLMPGADTTTGMTDDGDTDPAPTTLQRAASRLQAALADPAGLPDSLTDDVRTALTTLRTTLATTPLDGAALRVAYDALTAALIASVASWR